MHPYRGYPKTDAKFNDIVSTFEITDKNTLETGVIFSGKVWYLMVSFFTYYWINDWINKNSNRIALLIFHVFHTVPAVVAIKLKYTKEKVAIRIICAFK